MDYMKIAKTIDWTNPSAMASKYFSVHELIYLPQWQRMANQEELSPFVCANLVQYAHTMDIVREFLDVPIYMHDCLRPKAYNELKSVGGAPNSFHVVGLAGDWSAMKMDCDQVRAKIIPYLPSWRMRCENRGKGAPWVHTDLKKVPLGGVYYFIP